MHEVVSVGRQAAASTDGHAILDLGAKLFPLPEGYILEVEVFPPLFAQGSSGLVAQHKQPPGGAAMAARRLPRDLSAAAQGSRRPLCFILLGVALSLCCLLDLEDVVRMTSQVFVGACSPTHRRQTLQQHGHGLHCIGGQSQGHDRVHRIPRPELPNSTEAMCRQAAAAVMRAYTDGYTRQAVRLRLDAAYSGQEDLRALLKASLPLAKSFAPWLALIFAHQAVPTSSVKPQGLRKPNPVATGGIRGELGVGTEGVGIMTVEGGDAGGGEDDDGSWEAVRDKDFSLGSTSGVIAAGAWAARLEVAGLIESGCSRQLLRLIRRGEESAHPLQLSPPIRGVDPSGRAELGATPRSERSSRADRTRSPVKSSEKSPATEEVDKDVADLLEGEGEKVDDVIAEQKMILAALAEGDKDPPWFATAKKTPETVFGTGDRSAPGLKMEPQQVTFSRRANPPPDHSAVVKHVMQPSPRLEESLEKDSLPTFARKAKPPPAGVVPEPVKPGSSAGPSGGGGSKCDSLEGRERESLKKYEAEALDIFEGMEVLGITMDITRYVRTSKGVDKDKFLLHAAPNRASTGLRYTRVMKGIMSWVESFDPIPDADHPSPLERLRVVEYIELLMQKGVGFNTPQTLLFALDFFSKAFGFNPTGNEWNRSKRLAMRYKKSKPGLANRAPLFGKETLIALEIMVLDEFSPPPVRVAAGKLRLCCQAAIRYDDLLHTPLSSLEWVRRKGGSRAMWQWPKRGGGDSGMNDREIDLLRWHGGKATLTSLMQHLELDPKMVRLAGDWAAKEDAMPDTYLREAQLMVLKGQESCLTYLRSGGDFGFLVSGGLVGAGPPGDGDVGSVPDASHVGANQNSADDAASRAKESSLKTNARLAGLRCEYPGLPGMELCAAFLDKGFDKDGQPLAEVAEEEAKAAPMPVEEVQKLLEPNNPDDDVYVVYSFDGQEKVVKAEPADEKQSSEAGVSELAMEIREPLDAVLEDDDDDLEGRTLRFAMIDKPTSSSKLHLPAVGTQKGEKTLVVPMPKCGARGNYSFVMAGDAMDPTTELCIRCFGHRSEGACGRLCSVKAKADDLERFLEDHVLGQNAYKQADGVVVTFPRQPAEPWARWKLSDDAASLRRLWAFARETARSEIEKMSGGDETRRKITLIEATAMETSALARGCPAPGSDRERPALYTLNRLGKALQTPGATYEVLPWETFISKEEEDRLTREGRLPKHSQTELILGSDSKVVARDKADEAGSTSRRSVRWRCSGRALN
eukprot:s178_g35.t1